MPVARLVLDIARGEARLGSRVVTIAAAGSRGEIQVGGPDGPILRPLTFGERTRAVVRARTTSTPRAGVAGAILQAATAQSGVGERPVLELLALALAGAEQDAPPFTATVALLARSLGWDYARLTAAEAADVDRLAIYLAGSPPASSSWNQLLLAHSPDDELSGWRDALCDTLLRRAVLEDRADGQAPAGDAALPSSGNASPPTTPWPAPQAESPHPPTPSPELSASRVGEPSPPNPLSRSSRFAGGRGDDQTLLFRSQHVHQASDDRGVINQRAKLPSPPLPSEERADAEVARPNWGWGPTVPCGPIALAVQRPWQWGRG